MIIKKILYNSLFYCVLLGALSSLALPPFSFFPLLMISLGGLLYRLKKAESSKKSFYVGFCWGMGYWLSSVYWMAHALLIEAESFAWLIVTGLPLLCAYFAFYTGVTCYFTYTLSKKLPPILKALLFSLLFVGSEWVRGHVFTGFPWNLIGHTSHISLPFMQLAAYVGIYGVSFFVLLIIALFYSFFEYSTLSACIKGPCCAIIIFAIIQTSGYYRLKNASDNYVPNVHLHIVQANIAQSLKWDSNTERENFFKHVELSSIDPSQENTVIIWPETALSYMVEDNLQALLRRMIPKKGYLITGARRESTTRSYQVWNSLYAINAKGEIEASYDKFHLTPFGEYIPLREILPLKKITEGTIDISPGKGLAIINVSTIPSFSPLICYEAIFPSKAVPRPHLNSAEWILNVTNDGWFGISTGPYQHFENVRFRAIEEGLPLIRAANTGISSIIDPYGRIKHQLPLGKAGVIQGLLPQKLKTPTFYSRMSKIVR